MSTTIKSPARYDELTVSQARTMRADQARLAALYADRVEQAGAADELTAAAHWLHEYRRSTKKCRLLGERIRRADRRSTASAPEPPPTPIGHRARSVPVPTPIREAA